MNALFTAAVERLSRVAGVRGALLVESEAGVPVVSELRAGVNETAVAALVASLFHVVAVDAGELILVVVADHDAQLGLVRFEAHRAAESIA